jgi:hypothetical protein
MIFILIDQLLLSKLKKKHYNLQNIADIDSWNHSSSFHSSLSNGMKRGHQQLDEEEKEKRVTIVKREPLQKPVQQQQPSQPDKGKGLAVKRSWLADDNKGDFRKLIDMVLKLDPDNLKTAHEIIEALDIPSRM